MYQKIVMFVFKPGVVFCIMWFTLKLRVVKYFSHFLIFKEIFNELPFEAGI